MDKLEKYSTLIKDILVKDAQIPLSDESVEPILLFDDKTQNYQLMYIGWKDSLRTHASLIHVRLQNNKIWIEEDGTEEGIATVLLEAGVPKEDIVLAFYSPRKRPYTGFAVA